MAEEAFALSPISARAAQPSEEDYAAISEAFMETSRGRWFLGEYAKRNRNADTRMVLDAVARIEENLSQQRQAAQDAAYEERVAEALNAIRGAIESVQASAIATLDGISFEQTLLPVRKGVRVIREISWRLREIGNDGRICDIIDSQASTIEAAAAAVSVDEAKAALDTAFATLAGRLAAFEPDEAAAPVAEAPVAEATAEVPVAEAHVAMTPEIETMAEAMVPAEAASPVIDHAPAAVIEDAVMAAMSEPVAEAAPIADVQPAVEAASVTMPTEPSATALAEAEAALAEAEAAELARVADEAEDEAVLDLIAAEMGAPDPIDDSEIMLIEEAHLDEAPVAEAPPMVEPEIVEPEIAEPEVALAPEPVAAPAPPPVVAPAPPEVAFAAPPAPEPATEVSLGSTIIASGLVRKPSSAANDPLAPIRRMSQAEKIAFFS